MSGDEEWQQIRRDVIAKIWDFLDHLRAGHFMVDPSEKQKTCRFCDFARGVPLRPLSNRWEESYPQIKPFPQIRQNGCEGGNIGEFFF